ncbi:hypothetical protein [Bosea sp. RAC05]|uniref:hypothetical protein n=1 Tax=Bosea sp. RAC05 TaxID=1842539 RepID=UPI00083D73FB|nr:hypothetical protein [Bosea sp. RAC05]
MPNDEKKPKPVLVEEIVANPELVLEMHLSKGDVAQAKSADVAPTEAERVAPGDVANADEAARRIAGMRIEPEAMARAAALMANMPQVDDEIDDAQARRFAQRRRAEVVGVPEMPVEPVPPPPPQNLPARVERNVFARDPDWVPPPADVQWLTIYDTPRYYQNSIRAFGRFVFRTFPCFVNHEEQATAAGHDPLGSIALLANMGPTGPNSQRELDQVAAWVSRNGRVVDATEIQFPTVIPGYTPRIIVAVTETETLLLVDEKRERGAPMDAMYIYRWRGGEGYYLDNPEALAGLNRVARQPALAAPPAQLAAPRDNAAPMRPAAVLQEAGRGARPQPVVRLDHMTEAAVIPDRTGARKAAIKALPVATAMVSPNPVVDLMKADGFRPFGTSSGPALRKSIGEGRVALIFGEPGTAITRSPTFRVEVEEGASRTVVAAAAVTYEDVLDAIALPAQSIKP